jgi:predicted DsbA family dithiol-disulfide isomerase
VKLEIWSDVACPFCLIGKRHLEQALESFPHADEVEITWRSFQLAPDMPREVPGTQLEHLARKYRLEPEQARAAQQGVVAMAAESGLELDLDRVKLVNTFDAHRLLQFAGEHGRAGELVDRLFTAYFIEGDNLADHDRLTSHAVAAGLDEEAARATLADPDAYADAVRADGATAQQFGLRGVPAFVLDRRFGLTGAQPPEVMLQGLQRAWDLHHDAAA